MHLTETMATNLNLDELGCFNLELTSLLVYGAKQFV